jgi:hypothetical protein
VRAAKNRKKCAAKTRKKCAAKGDEITRCYNETLYDLLTVIFLISFTGSTKRCKEISNEKSFCNIVFHMFLSIDPTWVAD